jgi:cytochrome P450
MVATGAAARARQLGGTGMGSGRTWIRSWEARVAKRAAAIVDAVAERGECDLVSDIASELPIQVVADLMGIPAWRFCSSSLTSGRGSSPIRTA